MLNDCGDVSSNAVRQGWSHIGMVHGLPKNKKRKGYRKYKSWREGRKAAKRGEPAGSCPYQLSESVIKLLLKRDRWFRGYESYAMTPNGSKALRIRLKREKEEKEKKRHKI